MSMCRECFLNSYILSEKRKKLFAFNLFIINSEFKKKNEIFANSLYLRVYGMPFDSHSRSTTGVQ